LEGYFCEKELTNVCQVKDGVFVDCWQSKLLILSFSCAIKMFWLKKNRIFEIYASCKRNI